MTEDGRPSIIDGATMSPAGDGSVTNRRRKVDGRAEEVRNRTLRREAAAQAKASPDIDLAATPQHHDAPEARLPH